MTKKYLIDVDGLLVETDDPEAWTDEPGGDELADALRELEATTYPENYVEVQG
jgi:hypothetical protein